MARILRDLLPVRSGLRGVAAGSPGVLGSIPSAGRDGEPDLEELQLGRPWPRRDVAAGRADRHRRHRSGRRGRGRRRSRRRTAAGRRRARPRGLPPASGAALGQHREGLAQRRLRDGRGVADADELDGWPPARCVAVVDELGDERHLMHGWRSTRRRSVAALAAPVDDRPTTASTTRSAGRPRPAATAGLPDLERCHADADDVDVAGARPYSSPGKARPGSPGRGDATRSSGRRPSDSTRLDATRAGRRAVTGRRRARRGPRG